MKAAKKENSEDTSNYKKQRQRAIEKAKNLIKKAEKARRVSSEKKSLQGMLHVLVLKRILRVLLNCFVFKYSVLIK